MKYDLVKKGEKTLQEFIDKLNEQRQIKILILGRSVHVCRNKLQTLLNLGVHM